MPKSIRKQFHTSEPAITKQLLCAKFKLIKKKHAIEAEKKVLLKNNRLLNESKAEQMKKLSDESAIATIVGASAVSMYSSIAAAMAASSVEFSADKESNSSIFYGLTAASFAIGALVGGLFTHHIAAKDYNRLVVLNQEYKTTEEAIRKIKI